MTLLQAAFAVWLVISALFCVVMGVDVILGWLKRPRADKGRMFTAEQVDMLSKLCDDGTVEQNAITVRTAYPKATIHYPMTDEQEAREETIKANDAKGIDTPIEDAI